MNGLAFVLRACEGGRVPRLERFGAQRLFSFGIFVGPLLLHRCAPGTGFGKPLWYQNLATGARHAIPPSPRFAKSGERTLIGQFGARAAWPGTTLEALGWTRRNDRTRRRRRAQSHSNHQSTLFPHRVFPLRRRRRHHHHRSRSPQRATHAIPKRRSGTGSGTSSLKVRGLSWERALGGERARRLLRCFVVDLFLTLAEYHDSALSSSPITLRGKLIGPSDSSSRRPAPPRVRARVPPPSRARNDPTTSVLLPFPSTSQLSAHSAVNTQLLRPKRNRRSKATSRARARTRRRRTRTARRTRTRVDCWSNW